MSRSSNERNRQREHRRQTTRLPRTRLQRRRPNPLPTAAYRSRTRRLQIRESFCAPETWHEPGGRESVEIVVEQPGSGFIHAVTPQDIRDRLALLPRRFTESIEVVQLSGMTRKRGLFPCYGMQWGPNVYLYPIEESLVEAYVRPPQPAQQIEARMFSGRWEQHGGYWHLIWTRETIRDFYLNNVLIHEIGHVNDDRNTSFAAREQYANWFAVEYGYRASRGRR